LTDQGSKFEGFETFYRTELLPEFAETLHRFRLAVGTVGTTPHQHQLDFVHPNLPVHQIDLIQPHNLIHELTVTHQFRNATQG
jgi:hypothetical protein